MNNPKTEVEIVEQKFSSPRHTTHYLAAGPNDGTPIILVHGWPERAISYRHVIPVLAGLGFRCYAPDMRGYGNSSVYTRHEDYCLEEVTKDLIELADHLGIEKAIWIGHDWGSPAVASVVAHHPDRVHGATFLCVPYFADGFVPENFIPLADRTIYPEDEHPAAQWDYQLFYEESFEKSQELFDKDVERTIKLFFRAGDPAGKGVPALTAGVRAAGGWLGGIKDDLKVFADGLRKNGFFGPDSWYMNHKRNGIFAKQAPNGGKLGFPVLMIHARYDYVCETVESRLMEPMRRDCSDLTEFIVDAGHWVAQEKPQQTSAAIVQWLARKFPSLWVRPGIQELKV